MNNIKARVLEYLNTPGKCRPYEVATTPMFHIRAFATVTVLLGLAYAVVTLGKALLSWLWDFLWSLLFY